MRPGTTGWSRPSLLTWIVGAATSLALVACAALAAPLLPALTWSLALAVVIQPVYRRLAADRYPSLSAAVGLFGVTVFIIGPAVLLGVQVGKQVRFGIEALQRPETMEHWKAVLERHPTVAGWVQWLQDQVDLEGQFRGALESAGKMLPAVLGGSLWIGMQLLVMLLILFYFLRDRDVILRWLREHSPFSETETSHLFDRVRDCLQATVAGQFVVALLQGTLGGLMMGMLGVPFAMLWGAVMALFSMVPTLGAPVVWIPAVVLLLAQGAWGKALILAGWGVAAVGLIDNLVYPVLVGRKMTLHTVPVLLSYLGGVVLFGFTGLVLGPLMVTMAWALLEIWRHRTARGRAATDAIAADVS